LEKQLSSQNFQIKDLAEAIKKFKLQKLELNQKLKEDKDSYNKLKNQRIK
jgi:septal ring factor EnvC (AmiA/AmiB activator)